MRPESLSAAPADRPVYTVSAAVGGSDLAGAVVGALAASAIAWQPTDPGQYATYMTVAQQVYQFGKAFPGLCAPPARQTAGHGGGARRVALLQVSKQPSPAAEGPSRAGSAVPWAAPSRCPAHLCLCPAAESSEAACRYANAQPVISCPSQFADVAPTAVTPYCPSRSIQLNGSSIPLFNSTTYYDKMLWAATWMYKVWPAALEVLAVILGLCALAGADRWRGLCVIWGA